MSRSRSHHVLGAPENRELYDTSATYAADRVEEEDEEDEVAEDNDRVSNRGMPNVTLDLHMGHLAGRMRLDLVNSAKHSKHT